MSIYSQIILLPCHEPITIIEDEPEQKIKYRESGWKNRRKQHVVLRKKRRTREPPEEKKSCVAPTRYYYTKCTNRTKPSNLSSCHFNGPSSVTVCYGLLSLMLVGCVSGLPQAPTTTVIRHPTVVGGWTKIMCGLESGSAHCQSVYWKLNETDLRVEQGYNFSFDSVTCIGVLTYYACSNAEIKCLVELISNNNITRNCSSEVVNIQIPDTQENTSTNICEGERLEKKNPGTTTESKKGMVDTQPDEDTNILLKTINSNGTDMPTGYTNGNKKNKKNFTYISLAVFIVPGMFIGFMVVICCYRRKKDCCKRRTRSRRVDIRLSETKESIEQETKPTGGGTQETTDQDKSKFKTPEYLTEYLTSTTSGLATQEKNNFMLRHQRQSANLRTSNDGNIRPEPNEVQHELDEVKVDVIKEDAGVNKSEYDKSEHCVTTKINHSQENSFTNDFLAVVGPSHLTDEEDHFI